MKSRARRALAPCGPMPWPSGSRVRSFAADRRPGLSPSRSLPPRPSHPMSHDEPPIYAGFVTRAAGYLVDDIIILTIGAGGVIAAGLILDAVIPGGVHVDVAGVLGTAAWGLALSALYFVGFWSLAGQTPGM